MTSPTYNPNRIQVRLMNVALNLNITMRLPKPYPYVLSYQWLAL